MRTTREYLEKKIALFKKGYPELEGEVDTHMDSLALHNIIEAIGKISLLKTDDGTSFTDGHLMGQSEMFDRVSVIIKENQ